MKPFDDPVLGRVEWNEDFGYWVAHFVLSDGNSAEFSVTEGDVDENVRTTFLWVCCNEHELRDELAARMLDLARNWRQEGDPEITAESFAERVRLVEASLDGDGALTMYYLDGGMFGSHLILAPVGADRVMDAPYLAG